MVSDIPRSESRKVGQLEATVSELNMKSELTLSAVVKVEKLYSALKWTDVYLSFLYSCRSLLASL